jgi:hypothetical protein
MSDLANPASVLALLDSKDTMKLDVQELIRLTATSIQEFLPKVHSLIHVGHHLDDFQSSQPNKLQEAAWSNLRCSKKAAKKFCELLDVQITTSSNYNCTASLIRFARALLLFDYNSEFLTLLFQNSFPQVVRLKEAVCLFNSPDSHDWLPFCSFRIPGSRGSVQERKRVSQHHS